MRAVIRIALGFLPLTLGGFLVGCPVPNGTNSASIAAPVFSIPGGLYSSDITVALSHAADGAVLYYSTDGSTPSILYAAPITVAGPSTTETIKAMATRSDGTSSAIVVETYIVATWVDRTVGSAPSLSYLVSNTDGSRLVASDGIDIWTSTNYGVTWTNQTTGTAASGLAWNALVSSADGSHLFSNDAGNGPADLWTSSDYGATWTNRTPSGPTHTQSWGGLATSSDGSHLAAAISVGGDIWTSTDYGVTWTDRTPTGPVHGQNWGPIASSADGSRLVAAVYGGDIWTSTDYGVTWMDRTSAGSALWVATVSSSDGRHLVAMTQENPGTGGLLWTSSDYGATWIDRTAAGGPATQSPAALVSNADGTRISVGSIDEDVWISEDAGATWIDTSPTGPAHGIGGSMTMASTADGRRLFAVGGGQHHSYSWAEIP